MLFLLFSMFIIGAALILLVLLFRLAIEQRTGQLVCGKPVVPLSVMCGTVWRAKQQ